MYVSLHYRVFIELFPYNHIDSIVPHELITPYIHLMWSRVLNLQPGRPFCTCALHTHTHTHTLIPSLPEAAVISMLCII